MKTIRWTKSPIHIASSLALNLLVVQARGASALNSSSFSNSSRESDSAYGLTTYSSSFPSEYNADDSEESASYDLSEDVHRRVFFVTNSSGNATRSGPLLDFETILTTGTSSPPSEYHWLFLCLIVLVVVGVLGNVLVCLAVCLERRLQNATNFFLLSLSVADLLVSLLVMPIAILNEFYGYWPFGSSICNLWVTCDVLCCSSSILHMCFISVGRYIGIRNPLHARQAPLLVSRRAVLVKIALAWLLSALITSPITILGLIDQKNVQPGPNTCSITNGYFLFLGSFSAFFLPMLVMVNSYVLTVSLLSRKAKFCQNAAMEGRGGDEAEEISSEAQANETRTDLGSGARSGHDETSHEQASSREPERAARGIVAKRTVSSSSESSFGTCRTKSRTDSSSSEDHSSWRGHGASRRPLKRQANNASSSSATPNTSNVQQTKATSTTSSAQSRGKSGKSGNRRYNTQPMMLRTLGSSLQVRTEQKATKVLGLVFFVFAICWTPFFCLNVLIAIAPKLQIPDYLATTFQWLGFLSSTMNPVIYTIFNRNFRRAFRKILLCQMFSASPSGMLSRKASQFDPYAQRRTMGGGGQARGASFSRSPVVATSQPSQDHGKQSTSNSTSIFQEGSLRPELSVAPDQVTRSPSQSLEATRFSGNSKADPQVPRDKWSQNGNDSIQLTWNFSTTTRRQHFAEAYNSSQL